MRKAKLIARWGLRADDSGSSPVQIACLTENIRNLTNHLKIHPKDKSTAYYLQKLISERYRVMKYFKRKNPERYYEVLKELGVKDAIKLNMYPLRSVLGSKKK